MAKEIKAKLISTSVGHLHLRDTTLGHTYTGLALEVGEVNAFNHTSQTGDEFQFTDDSGDVVVTHLAFGWEVVDDAQGD